jgi:signal peptidase I
LRYFSLTPTWAEKQVFYWGSLFLFVARLFDFSFGFLALELITAITLLVFFFQYRYSRKAKQRALNSVLSELQPQGSYYLYLRPFGSAKKYRIKSALRNWGDRALCGRLWDIETALSFALQRYGPIFAIGDKYGSIGAIKVFTDDTTWKEKFAQLCHATQLIFILPFQSPSTAWEIRQVVENADWRSKAIFVMPPTLTVWGRIVGFVQKSWERSSEEMASTIRLPAYQPNGALFTINADGSCREQGPIDNLSDKLVGKLVERKGSAMNTLPIDEPAWFDRIPWKWIGFEPNFGYATSIVLILACLARIWGHSFSIPSDSNSPTLMIGDYIFGSYAYGINLTEDLPLPPFRIFRHEAARGDLVPFHHPRDWETTYIRRVIGFPGDKIQMKDGLLYINGEPVKRDRLVGLKDGETVGPVDKLWRETLPNGVSYEARGPTDLLNAEVVQVPPGHYFVMGDNRDNSLDRHGSQIGNVPFDNLIAKARIVYFSVKDGYDVWEFWQWPWSVRWERLLTIVP